MASNVAERPTGRPPSSAANVTSYGTTRRPGAGASGWETFSWYFFRISGVGLVFLALIHVFLMHVSTDVSQTVYDFVADRYNNPFWRVYDLLLLTLALFHGLNGLRIVCDDYITSRGWRLTAQSVLFFIAITFWLMGSMTIITFHKNENLAQSVGALIHTLIR
ncbi:MAG TPA: succinate dehydrogenase, hydrophobic membrane anchor protein [Ktedonobacterales bacterium]|nr:succinate dehydrogenase, hydrophobic membrane anchor protein [Ktedonobacterales bacterium]